jgi:hypothetical protein
MTIHERLRERVSRGATLAQLEGEIARTRCRSEDEEAALWLLAWHYLNEREARMPAARHPAVRCTAGRAKPDVGR